MDALKEYLPPAKGLLPYYMLVTSVLAVGNALQNYVTLHFSRRLYPGKFVRNPALGPKTSTFDPDDSTQKFVPASSPTDPKAVDQVTPLAARLFGTYTLISAIVRLYASYNLDVAPVYQIALWTYVVALAHFGSEHVVYKTYPLGGPQLLPFFFATLGITWMLTQKAFYLES